MMKDPSWRGTHIHLTTLEKAVGRKFKKLRDEVDFPTTVELSIRLPRSTWKKYHIEDAVAAVGLSDKAAIYVNI